MIVAGQAGTRYPWEPLTIAQLLDRTAEEHGAREAMVDDERRVTWAQARAGAHATAKALLAAGIERGDHVAVWMPNSIEWVQLWFGASAVGAVLVCVNTRYKTEEVSYIVRQSDAKLLVMVDQFVGIDYLAMLARMDRADFPELRGVVVLGDAPEDTQPFADFVAAGASVPDAAVDEAVAAGRCEDPSIIVYTSGTTGHPKGAVHSSAILRNEHSISEAMDIDASSRVMNHMPFFHVAGGFTGILPPLITGGAMIIMERWDPRYALELIERERATVFSGIPTHFIDVLNHPDLASRDVSSLRTGWIGGANNPPEVIDAIMQRLGMNGILPVYGMTETTSITTIPRLSDARSVIVSGRGFPVSDFEVRVVDVETGAELDAGVEGEVCVRGHLVMQGYYRNEEATAAVIDADGWFHTGDLGDLDENGYLAITGRKSDMFIVGGSNAYPAEIEIALSEEPRVKQAYVVGVPHERLGEVGFAFVELCSGEACSEDDIVSFCKGRLADYKVPRFVRFVDEWPMTATGKIQRFRLQEMARESVAEHAPGGRV